MMDRNSETWLTLRRVILDQIEQARDNLEQPGYPPDEARGEIRALRWIIKQVEPDAPIPDAAGVDYMQVYNPT